MMRTAHHASASGEAARRVCSGTEQPCFIDSPRPPFQRADLEAWLKLMPRADLGLLVGATRTEWERRGLGSTNAAARTLPVCASRQCVPARTHVSDFPPEILSLIFSHVDTATLLGAVPHVCRDWRAACAHDLYGPKVRLELHSVRQVLRIRPECLGLWVAATVGRFAWVIDLDLSGCGIEDGVLECASSLQRITSLNLVALALSQQDHGHGAGARCPTHAAHQPELESL